MKVLKLLEELEDLIDESSSIPFGNKVLLDKKEALEIIKEVRIQLPDEIKQAEWINRERQRLLLEAQHEADSIIENAKSYVQEKVEASEIIKEAKKHADEIILDAQKLSKDIRLGANEYADDLLKGVQDNLEKLISTVSQNRVELGRIAKE